MKIFENFRKFSGVGAVRPWPPNEADPQKCSPRPKKILATPMDEW